MHLINDATAVRLSVAIRGDDGSLSIPTTLKYRLDGDTALIPWTSVTPESITTISIPATANTIPEGKSYEDRTFTAMTDEGLPTQRVQVQRYRVEGLGGVP